MTSYWVNSELLVIRHMGEREDLKSMRRLLVFCFLCLVLLSLGIAVFSGRVPLIKEAGQPLNSDIEGNIPSFDHVIWVVLENKNYEEVIGSSEMPYLNKLAEQYILLDHYYAVRHPSLPNYIALVGGSTFHISSDCKDCFINEVNLADLIEAAGRTWKTYQEDMPSACFVGNMGQYVQKHNPFIYFDSIRLDKPRCERSIVPLEMLERDLEDNTLPDFALISPNLCHSGHDCGIRDVDRWLEKWVNRLIESPALGENSLIVITFDEAKKGNTESCCGLGWRAGGRVATILVSPLAKSGFVDSTRLSHYSLLKTVLQSWHLPDLGTTKDARIKPIIAPWN